MGRIDEAGGQKWAYMCLCRAEDSSELSEDLLRYKANLIREVLSANLTNAVLYRIARLQGEVDALTGAYTRRVLEEKLQAEYDRAIRYRHPFCLVMVDVDRVQEHQRSVRPRRRRPCPARPG